MPNKITVAEHAGFCFGVKRATDAVEKRLLEKREGERIYTLGHLIHNEGYNRYLEEQEVKCIGAEDIYRICEESDENHPSVVFIRAHGIPVETEKTLAECKENNPFFDYVDLTCPYVKKIHKARQMYQELYY